MAGANADDDDDIDAETLQAQVELSLAYTQDLVSSWMQSSKAALAPSRPRHEEERALQEYMRRPPRLGVGAAVPESAGALGRDAARLKGKLAEKKRAREEEDAVAAVPSEDEEESRAGAIKKKAKLDPFAPRAEGKGKKAKKNVAVETSTPAELPPLAASRNEDQQRAEEAEELTFEGGAHDPTDSPKKKKKKKKKHAKAGDASVVNLTESASVVNEAASQPVAGPSGSPAEQLSEEALKETKETSIDLSDSPRKHAPVSQATSTVTSSAASPFKSSQTSPRKLQTNTPLLLNLEGPPEASGDETSVSPKKKRKRRKKKKKAQVEDGEAVEEEE